MDSNATLAPPLRLLEEFTRESNYPNNGNKVVARMYRHLFTKEKYFKQVRRLIETRIPPLLETTTRPPTALGGSSTAPRSVPDCRDDASTLSRISLPRPFRS